VALVYAYRVRMSTCLNMYMENWLNMARDSGGTIYAQLNQVRQAHGNDGFAGARTGRLSASLFMNVPKNFEDKDDGYKHPAFLKDLPPLPLMRRYVLPDKGGVFCHRDYNQQELRGLGHFEGGGLMRNYQERPYRNPDGSMRFDIHTVVQNGIHKVAGFLLSRSGTKIVNFSDIYGKGETNLALSLGVDTPTVKLIKQAKNQLMPGVAELTQAIRVWGQRGQPIRTWGGREYFAETPKYVDKYKRVMDFFYKLLNYEIQGSSADVTKEALVRYHNHPKKQARFLVAVHDEINVSAPRQRVREEMAILRESMESIEMDVPMLSDGKTGPNWAELKKFWNADEAKEIV
jgi:DNA polymerase I-like protein with 3'-5' exonuclease and polymerase domains